MTSETQKSMQAIPSTDAQVTPQVIGRFVLRCVLMLLLAAGICAAGIRWVGPWPAADFTLCPTAFLVNSLFLVGTGGLIGMAAIGDDGVIRRSWLDLGLACGAISIGLQCYGAQTLFPYRFSPRHPHVGLALILVFIHIAVSFLVLQTVAFVASAGTGSAKNRLWEELLKFCRIYWFGLGIVWTGLLCAFAMLLSQK